MKFIAAATALALSTSFSVAFVPAINSPVSKSLKMSADETPTYTFTKSEEVFAEALEVSKILHR
jgi:hypothetical protein